MFRKWFYYAQQKIFIFNKWFSYALQMILHSANDFYIQQEIYIFSNLKFVFIKMSFISSNFRFTFNEMKSIKLKSFTFSKLNLDVTKYASKNKRTKDLVCKLYIQSVSIFWHFWNVPCTLQI